MKILISLMLLFAVGYGSQILWSQDYILQPGDFTVIQSFSDTDVLASTTTKLLLKGDKCYAYFNTKKSYMKESVYEGENLKEVLNHEQGHFDLTEYIARRISDKIKNVNNPLLRKKIFDQYTDTLDVIQTVYDVQTSHYNDKVWQAKWDVHIQYLLLTKSSNWKMYP